MALVLADRVQQTGTANTTVSFTLSGSVTGFQSFSVIGNTNTTYYAATDASGNWEVGIGTYSTTGPTLTRTTILSSSNAGSAVTFSGTVNVFVTYPADTSVSDGKTNVIEVNSTDAALRITQTGTGNALVVEDDNPDSTPFVVDTTGRVITGATQAYANYLDGFVGTARNPTVQINGTSLSFASSSLTNWANADSPPLLVLAKSKSGTVGTMTSTFSVGDVAGAIQFSASDNTNFVPTALIEALIDGTTGTGDMPGCLVFSTTADGASLPTERMRINSAGNVGIGRTAEAGYILDIANPDTASGADTFVRISSSASAGDADAELVVESKGTGEAILRLKEDGVSKAALYTPGDGDSLIFANQLTVADLSIIGADTTVLDPYSVRYSRPTGASPVTGITGTITSSANTSTITGLSTTTGLVIGMILTRTAGTGVLGTQACIQSIDSASQITVTNGFAAMTAGSITFTATPIPTTITAFAETASSTWTVDQDFARFGFANSDGTGAGDGGIKASINAYVYNADGTGAGLDFYVSSNGTTLTKALRLTQTGVYGTTVGATYRTAYIDNTGVLGGLTSLRAAKTNIVEINEVNWLLLLKPVMFNYRLRDIDGNWTDESAIRVEYGLIADDVEEIKPELCIYDDDENKTGLRGIEYGRLITPMLKLLQEQQKAIDAMKVELAALKGQ